MRDSERQRMNNRAKPMRTGVRYEIHGRGGGEKIALIGGKDGCYFGGRKLGEFLLAFCFS